MQRFPGGRLSSSSSHDQAAVFGSPDIGTTTSGPPADLQYMDSTAFSKRVSVGPPLRSTGSSNSSFALGQSTNPASLLFMSSKPSLTQQQQQQDRLPAQQDQYPSMTTLQQLVIQPAEQQQQQQRQRQRAHLTLPAATFCNTNLFSLNHTPPLLASEAELDILEPRAPIARSNMHAALGPRFFGPSSAGNLYESVSANVDAHRPIVTSPTAWAQVPMTATSSHYQHPMPRSSDSIGAHANEPGSGTLTRSTTMVPASSMGHRGSPPTSATTISTSSAQEHGSANEANGAAKLGPMPLAPETSNALKHLKGATATAVRAMLQELPTSLQPVVMAKVAVRGRGGRQPAADPRSTDPSMDPRKVRRILANRQSAAKSKLKTRVLLETLKVGKDVLAEQHGNVREELERLTQLVKDLETRNKHLETRLALSEQQLSHQHNHQHMHLQQQQQQYQQGLLSQNYLPQGLLPQSQQHLGFSASGMADEAALMVRTWPGTLDERSALPPRTAHHHHQLSQPADLRAAGLLRGIPGQPAVSATDDSNMEEHVKGWWDEAALEDEPAMQE